MDFRGRPEMQKVGADGIFTRYQGSVHDGVWNKTGVSPIWVVPQKFIFVFKYAKQLLSLINL